MDKKEPALLDEEAIHRVLARNKQFAAELIIRLAWQAGLGRHEIQNLTWDQVFLEEAELRVNGRVIPIPPDLLACLQKRRSRPSSKTSPYVVLTDSRRTHPEVVQLSSIVARAMAEEETLKSVRLKELREDFIARTLLRHGKAYTVRVAGVSPATIQSRYSQCASQPRGAVTVGDPTARPTFDEAALLRILHAEGSSPAAIALWLIWKQGMTLEETVALTWAEVDFARNRLTLGDRELELHPIVAQLLRETHAQRTPDADPHVLLSPKAKRPYERYRMSVLIHTALMRGGMEDLNMSKLARISGEDALCQKLLQFMEGRPFVTRNQVMAALALPKADAFKMLRIASERGLVVRIGTRYYLPGSVVPPEEHFAVISSLMREDGAATLGEIAKRLGVEKRACYWILDTLVKEGKLERHSQKYMLASPPPDGTPAEKEL